MKHLGSSKNMMTKRILEWIQDTLIDAPVFLQLTVNRSISKQVITTIFYIFRPVIIFGILLKLSLLFQRKNSAQKHERYSAMWNLFVVVPQKGLVTSIYCIGLSCFLKSAISTHVKRFKFQRWRMENIWGGPAITSSHQFFHRCRAEFVKLFVAETKFHVLLVPSIL